MIRRFSKSSWQFFRNVIYVDCYPTRFLGPNSCSPEKWYYAIVKNFGCLCVWAIIFMRKHLLGDSQKTARLSPWLQNMMCWTKGKNICGLPRSAQLFLGQKNKFLLNFLCKQLFPYPKNFLLCVVALVGRCAIVDFCLSRSSQIMRMRLTGDKLEVDWCSSLKTKSTGNATLNIAKRWAIEYWEDKNRWIPRQKLTVRRSHSIFLTESKRPPRKG